MKFIAHSVLLFGFVVIAASSWAQSAAGLPMCSAEIQQVLAAALQYGLGSVPSDYSPGRFDLKSSVVPDYGILRDKGQIYVRNYVDDPKCIIDARVLPSAQNIAFTLVDEDQIRELAQRKGDGVRYVRAVEVRLREGEAAIMLGVALRQTPGDQRGLTCCCGGEMVLRRVSANWQFVEWRNVLCA